jgi:hypothetical protein
MKKIFLLLFTLLSVSSYSQIPTQVPTNGLVAYYGFNGNTSNSVNALHNGIPHHISLTTDRFGNPNSAYQFNGTNSYINIGTIHSPSFTYSAWVYVDTIIKMSSIISRLSDFYGNNNAEVNIDSTNIFGGSIGYQYYISTGLNSASGPYSSMFNPASNTQNYLNNKSWYHLSLSYDDNSRLSSIYLNGTLITRNNTIPSSDVGYQLIYIWKASYQYDSSVSMYIGARPSINNNVGNFFHGKIDDIAIYNKALPDSSIYNLYMVSYPGTINDTIYDTITITINDTIHHQVYDTTHITMYDSLTIYTHDTLWSHITDTINLGTYYDTTYVTMIDTLLNSDTLFISINTGISNNSWNTIKIYPNPTSDHIYINCGKYPKMNGYSIKITNTLGQIVFQNNISQPFFYIPLSNFGGPGTYFVQFYDNNGNLKDNKQIILQ